jgi:archaellum biogenesis ATPase FlaH
VVQAATGVVVDEGELSKHDVNFVAEKVAQFCQTKAAINEVLASAKLIEKGEIGTLVQRLKAVSEIGLHRDLGIDYFQGVAERITKARTAEELIPTGWDEVDQLIDGGVGRQELITFVANSGGGKSVGMLNLGYNLLKRGLNGVYITLEMRDSVVAKRTDSMISKIAGVEIFDRVDEVARKVEELSKTAGRFFIKRMREGTTTANDIIAYLRQLESVHGFTPDFVIVDYLDIMAPIQKGHDGNLFLKDKFVSEEVRAIGFDFNCIMISASQLGRAAIEVSRDGKSLGQDHIQGGISKINTSDLTIALVKTEAMDAAGEYRFEFLKSRNSGAVNKHVTLQWDAVSLRITSNKSLEFKRKQRLQSSLAEVRPGSQTKRSISDLLSNPKGET